MSRLETHEHEPRGRLARAIDAHPLLVSIVIFAAEVAIRLPNLGRASLTLDEADTLSVALQPLWEILSWSARDQNPPLYFILVSGWVEMFGVSEAAARSFSLIASALTGFALFRLARVWFGHEASLVSLLLYTVSDLHFAYAQEARSYALSTLLVVLSFGLFLRNFAAVNWRNALLLALINAAAAYVHFTTIFAFVGQLAAALLFFRTERRALVRYVASQVVALALFAPWLGRLRANLPKAGTFWLATPDLDKLGTTVLDLTNGAWAAGLYGALFLAALGVRLAGARLRLSDPRPLGVLACWSILPVLLSFAVAQWTPVFSSRYVLFASPGLYLLGAVLLASLPVPVGYRRAAALLLIAASIAGLDRVVSARKTDWRSAAATIARYRTPGTVVFPLPGYQCLPLAYYLEPTAFLDRASMLGRLGSSGVFCLDGRWELRRVARPSSRLITVQSRLSPLDPEQILLHYGRSHFQLVARERVEGITMLVFDVQ